jgi:transposase
MGMRGKKQAQRQFVAMIDVNARIPENHPIREIKRLSDEVFGRLNPRFEAMYSEIGRPSIPPERLLGARLLMALFSVPSERAFCERLRYDLLFQWFLDLELEEEPFDASTFSKNQQRFVEHQLADEFLAEVVDVLKARGLLSDEHFSVDGTLIDAWASLKSFRPKDEGDQGPKDSNGWGDFSGQSRSNDTHESRTDPQAKLLKKGEGKEAKLCYTGHAVMENRHGFSSQLRSDALGGGDRKPGGLGAARSIWKTRGLARRRWGPTKTTTTGPLWPAAGPKASNRMWPPSRIARWPVWTGARPAARATRSARPSASAPNKSLGGPRRWVGCAGAVTAGPSVPTRPASGWSRR